MPETKKQQPEVAGAALRAAREAAGLTRIELARLAGCSPQYVALVEGPADPNSPALRRLIVLLGALGYPPEGVDE